MSRSQLPPDGARTLLAGGIAALAFGGWIYALLQPALRASLSRQSVIWWLEQLATLAQGVLCVGVVANLAKARTPALALTLVLFFLGTAAWFRDAAGGSFTFPLTTALNALLAWRLFAATTRAPVVDKPAV